MEPKQLTESALLALQKQRGISGRERRLVETALSLSCELARLKEVRTRQQDQESIEEVSRGSKVLVIVYHDGHIETYADRDTDIRVAHFPRVHWSNETLAEQIVEYKLPGTYREIYLPGNLRARGNVSQCPSVIEMEYMLALRDNLRLLNSIKGGKKP